MESEKFYTVEGRKHVDKLPMEHPQEIHCPDCEAMIEVLVRDGEVIVLSSTHVSRR